MNALLYFDIESDFCIDSFEKPDGYSGQMMPDLNAICKFAEAYHKHRIEEAVKQIEARKMKSPHKHEVLVAHNAGIERCLHVLKNL